MAAELNQLIGASCKALFRKHISAAIEESADLGVAAAVLLLNLDHFKKVNDSLGHAAGDELLVAVANRLRGCVRDEDTISRLGGDEFAILLADLNDESEIYRITTAIEETLAAPVTVQDQEIFIGASLGIALSTTGDADADIAMYAAKRAGRGKSMTFTSGMDQAVQERLELEADLHYAVERGEISVCYQPIVDLATHRMTSFEALVQTITQLGKTFQLATIAEGIETEDQAEKLAEPNCDLGQGYFFAWPLSAVDIELLLDLDAPLPTIRRPSTTNSSHSRMSTTAD